MEHARLAEFEEGLDGLIDRLSKKGRVKVFRSVASVIGAELRYSWTRTYDKRGDHFEILERAEWPESGRFEKEKILGIYLQKDRKFIGHYPGFLYCAAFSGAIDPAMRKLVERVGGRYESYIDIGRKQIKLPRLKLSQRLVPQQ